jgi:protein-disulfide isomerase
VDPERDHVYGPADARYEIVEYGDFQCPFCSKASGVIQEVKERLGDDLRYVWRHAPLIDQHPNALAGAEAAEAAALQGRFWEYERGLFADQENQRPSDIVRLAETLGLDVPRFERDLESAAVTSRVRDDMLDAEAMAISSVPTFFINGHRHVGPYDARSLLRAVQADDLPDPTPRS